MRYLSGVLVFFLGIGCLNAASAATTCVVDSSPAEDSDWIYGVGPRDEIPDDYCGRGGLSLGNNLSCLQKKTYDLGACDREFYDRYLSNPQLKNCDPSEGIELELCDPLASDYYDLLKRELRECEQLAEDDYSSCLNKKSARLPQKACRANAKHGKQARAGFKQTQRGCPAKAPKSKVKATKLTKTKAIRR